MYAGMIGLRRWAAAWSAGLSARRKSCWKRTSVASVSRWVAHIDADHLGKGHQSRQPVVSTALRSQPPANIQNPYRDSRQHDVFWRIGYDGATTVALHLPVRVQQLIWEHHVG